MFLDESILNEESEAMKAVKKHKEDFLKVAKSFLKDIKDAKADDENEETEDDLNLIKGQLEALIKQVEDAVSGKKSVNEEGKMKAKGKCVCPECGYEEECDDCEEKECPECDDDVKLVDKEDDEEDDD
jgi:hypothetical protein